MRKIALLLLLLSTEQFLSGQGFLINQDGNRLQVENLSNVNVDLSTTHVISDFGLRDQTGISRWHRGIDLNPAQGNNDLGYTIRSFSSGNIASIHVAGTYKVLSIDGPGDSNFGYGHIFRSTGNSLEDFEFIYVETLLDYVIIYLAGQGGSYALTSKSDNVISVVSFSHEGIVYSLANGNLRNDVVAGDRIAPLGDADATNIAHIHLYSFVDPYITNITSIQDPSNCKDPLQHLTHDEPAYSITIQEVIQRYGSSASSIEIWATMGGEATGSSYVNSILNVDIVNLYLRKDPSSQGFWIAGPNFNSTISDGSRTFSRRYPAVNNPAGNTVDILDRFGSSTATGYTPVAYRTTEGHPRDNYFFADFVTRLHKNHSQGQTISLASINHEARYSDGRYYLKGEVETVLSNSYESGETELLIDNFRPFIKKVIIQPYPSNVPGAIVYNAEWQWQNSQNTLDQDRISDANGVPLLVSVVSSEPLSELSVSISNGNSWILPSSANSSSEEFTFVLPASYGSQTLTFSGHDLNNNELDSNPATIATKTGANSWEPSAYTNPGYDTNHTFNTGVSCSPGNITPLVADNENQRTTVANAVASGSCVFADIDVSKGNPEVGEAIIIKAITGPFTTLSWNFGAGAMADNASDPDATEVTLYYTTSGTKSITLTVDSQAFTELVYVGAPSPQITINSVTVNGNQSSTGMIGDEFSFQADISGATGTANYQWDFGDGASYSSTQLSNPVVSYYTTGSKTIRLTVTDASSVATKAFNSKVYISNYPPLHTEITQPVDQLDYPYNGYVSFDHFTWGGDGSLSRSYFWDFGDGSYSTQQSPTHRYSIPGNFTVSLTVCDNSGCANDVKTNWVRIGENGPNQDFWNLLLYANGLPVPNSTTGDLCPDESAIPKFELGTPVTFNVDVDRGGGGEDAQYNI